VISIGNLSVGGTGKTTMVRWICEKLRESGLKVCVLSRGHKGEHEYDMAVVSTDKKVILSAKEAGDEADMLARQLPGVPVLVGKDRRKSGAEAIRQFQPDAIVLDDGMQFYQLHRNLDVVLIDCTRPFDNGWTFPRGLLREPPSHLRRAEAVVLTHIDKVSAEQADEIARRVERYSPKACVARAYYEPSGLRPLDRSGDRPVNWLSGKRVATFCALGNPEAFEAQVAACGAEIVSNSRFPDHHSVNLAELNALIEEACATSAEAVIVSEKDAVKLPPLGRPLPFLALCVDLKIDKERELLAVISRTGLNVVGAASE
jgi:tetraacyldisaccharide 4'-kinase